MAYLLWNMHEPCPGQFFDWSGQADAVEFCRIAQAARASCGSFLRPGPYACAEWEMGGAALVAAEAGRRPACSLPTQGDIKLRSLRPEVYGTPAKAWLKEVAAANWGHCRSTTAGPIIMVQVLENEYGSFGKDVQYMEGDIRQAARRRPVSPMRRSSPAILPPT